MRVYIVKYALTNGILETEAKETKFVEMINTEEFGFLHGEGKEWTRTREEAVSVAENMRAKKIASLQKQINKLENLNFSK